MIGIPLTKIYLEASERHTAFEILMRTFYRHCSQAEISAVVFGDIFLEDLRTYRVELLKESRLTPIFPLWKSDSAMLIHDFINSGFKTLMCAANAKYFSNEALGRTIDQQFLKHLPAGVDPCGENGEFHTFVYDGPLFKRPLDLSYGEVITKHYTHQQKNEDGSLTKLESDFLFQELLPLIK
jgi:uncharacterized protein (TIGR00290 family)